MQHTLIVNVDELWLKQKKRPYYMGVLKKNISAVLKNMRNEASRLCRVDNQRLVVSSDQEFSKECLSALQCIPGIHSISPAIPLPIDEALIVPTVLKALADRPNLPKTFAVRTHRGNKQFKTDSMTLSKHVGAEVIKHYPQLTVDLQNPDCLISIKISSKQIFIIMETLPAVGGIPVGTSGHVVSLISGGFDSPVASYLMSKRGCQLTLVFCHAYPFVGHAVLDKIKQLARSLGRFQQGIDLHILPFGPLQEAIAKSCKEEYRTLLFRHYMIKAADQLAHRIKADALCMGDALSQVSSQAMRNIAVLDRSTVRPIFRPLIGFNKVEVI